MIYKSKQLLESLIQEVEHQKQYIKSHVAPLEIGQLNKKPGVDKWSALECIEHLNRYSEFYITQFNNAISNGKKASNGSFRSGLLGNYFVNSMLPKEGVVANKMNTFKSKNPTDSSLDKKVIDKHLNYQDKLLTILNKMDTIDLNKNKVPTTLGKVLKIKLGDCLRFYIAHMTRHYIQLKNALL